jgi:hypothetical protein
MMVVLAGDGEEYRFGEDLSDEESPLGLNLDGLK